MLEVKESENDPVHDQHARHLGLLSQRSHLFPEHMANKSTLALRTSCVRSFTTEIVHSVQVSWIPSLSGSIPAFLPSLPPSMSCKPWLPPVLRPHGVQNQRLALHAADSFTRIHTDLPVLEIGHRVDRHHQRCRVL